MNTRLTLLALTVASLAAAQPAAPGDPAAAGLDGSANLPALIRAAQQVVLYAPELSRADVAEAIRLAITQRGTRAYLITAQAPLMYDDSLTFRLALMRVPTYITKGQAAAGVPFVLLDGRALVGTGVTGPGSVRWASAPQAKSLAAWVKTATSERPLNVVETLKQWVARRGGPTLK